jgi:predicted Rossmann fold nucleotide-binding protein DprA/Smf involved in DNA uptake
LSSPSLRSRLRISAFSTRSAASSATGRPRPPRLPPLDAAVGVPTPDELPVPAELPETEAAVLSGVGFEPTEVDTVAGRSGVEMHELLPALALLELKGYVTRNLGGAFVRRSAP